MIIPERPSLERRLLDALERPAASPGRIPVLLGGCGSGRTSVLLRLRDLVGRGRCQYIDVERVASTPERCLTAVRQRTPFASASPRQAESARAAFDAILMFLQTARTADGGQPATFLLDEFLELRTFESFPGLRTVLRDLLGALAAGSNRVVLTSRYTARALKLLRDAPDAFEIVHVAPLSPAEIRATLPARVDQAGSPFREAEDERALDELARLVHALSDGRPAYARAIAETAAAMDPRAADPVSALSALLAEGGQLARTCRFCYELRLHRARGYGALKAILGVLAAEEPLTLTEIAGRLGRTPGSTKDYLSWLEDVDLLGVQRKRYSFADPLLRLWVRLHGTSEPPGDEDLAREVHAYVLARLPAPESDMAGAAAHVPREAREHEKNWGIIEID